MSPQPRKHRIWPLIVLLILVHLSTVLYTLPLNRLIELRLCQTYYTLHDPSSIEPDASIHEVKSQIRNTRETSTNFVATTLQSLCKIDDVQQQLAWLQGTMDTTAVLCGT